MLFTGGTSSKPKREDKKDKKLERDEKYELQENVFVRWANSLLAGERLSDWRQLHEPAIGALVVQVIICQPVLLTGAPSEDWSTLLAIIGDSKINLGELCEGQQKAVIAFWWSLVQFFWKHYAPMQLREEKLSEAIKQWCLESTREYDEVNVCDFTSSWRDGYAFNYLLHSFNKKLVNLSRIAEMGAIERLECAFATAEKELRVARLLMARELHSEHLDAHSVVCYLMTVYLSMMSQCNFQDLLPLTSGQEGSQSVPTSPSTSTPAPLLTAALPPAGQMRTEDRPTFKTRTSIEVGEQQSLDKSAKNKKRKEEQMAEFENCIEQVLTWLLEAEEQLTQLTSRQRTELPAVRSQFADFEGFMSSLTDSQDTVGRVLVKGQVLGNKAESEEEREAIAAKLQLVNNKWETLREEAMRRQSQLQTQINSLQQRELENIDTWLGDIELEIASFAPLASTSKDALQQIIDHDRFQSKIDEYQQTIDKLESFVAVVDEENEESVASLEDALHSVSERWQKVCEWAEKRATKLDGLAELIEKTISVFEKLSKWLTTRENELAGLKSAHHLEKRRAGRSTANQVRLKLDEVTQRWDNLVARIEECSKTLVKSGKADVKQLETSEGPAKEGEPSSEGLSTDTEVDETKNLLVDKFLMHISKLSHELVPLQQWSESFTVSRKSDQVRRMMNTCQEKLLEIKEQESRVNRLQLELEHLHAARLNAKQLKRANDAFEQFAKGWARIVTKISEAMNVLTGHAQDGEEAAVGTKIEQWLSAVDRVISELALLPVEERKSRIDKLEQQLQVQAKNVSFIEKDLVKKAILKKGLDIAAKRLGALKKADEEAEIRPVAVQVMNVQPSTSAEKRSQEEEDVIKELDGPWSTIGDVEAIEKDLERAQKAVFNARNNGMSNETVEKAETRRAEMEEKKKVTISAAERIRLAEKTLNEIEDRVTALGKCDTDLPEVIKKLEEEGNKLASSISQRKEAERTAEKMLTMDDDVSEEVVQRTRAAVEAVVRRWDDLAETIRLLSGRAAEAHADVLRRRLDEAEELLKKVEDAIEASQKTVDAEEAAEQLDNLEYLLEKLAELEDLSKPLGDDPSDLARRAAAFETKRADVQKKAGECVGAVSDTMNECEEFEKQISDYQAMATDFNYWHNALAKLQTWLQRPGNTHRLHEQLDHAQESLNDLSRKFNEFKRPKAFEEKLEKVAMTLSHVENSLDDMTGIEAAECGGALMEARSLMRTLEASDEDIRSLEDTRAQLLLRANTSIERLEDCVEMFGRLREESDEIERFLDDMEKRLDTFAAGDRPEDDDLVNTLISEWNRNEASMNNAAQLQRLLRERAVKLSDDVLVMKRVRADALKNRLNSWSRSIQEMNDDEESSLLEIDALHKNLNKQLDEVQEASPAQITERLMFLRADRDRLSSRTRKLAARNPRLANNELMSTLNKKWSNLEQKASEAPTETPTAIQPLRTPPEDAAFHEKVDELSAQFSNISAFLDFDATPVASVAEYKQRLDEMDDWIKKSRPVVDEVVSEGKLLANTGRMELTTHTAIDKLDELIDVVESVEHDLESHESKVAALCEQSESLQREVTSLEEIVDTLAARDLTDVDIANATRRELAERDAYISSLTQSATAIHCSLPGKSPQTRDSSLDKLSEKICALESVLAKVPIIEEKEQKEKISPDRTSNNSIPPLAMEAHGTATEDEDDGKSRQDSMMLDVEPKTTVLPEPEPEPEAEEFVTKVDVISDEADAVMDPKRREEDVQEMFERLDELEDAMTNYEEYPFDHIDGAETEFAETKEILDECEKCVEQHEMIMNIVQCESARERIKILRESNANRIKKYSGLRDEWRQLNETAQTAEQIVSRCEEATAAGADATQLMSEAEKSVCDALKLLSVTVPRMDENSLIAKRVCQRVYGAEDRFRKMSAAQQEAAAQAKLSNMNEAELRKSLQRVLQWCEKVGKVVNGEVNNLDIEALTLMDEKLEKYGKQFHDRRVELAELECAKDVAVTMSHFSEETKHEIRRLYSEASKEVAKLRTDVTDTKNWVQAERQKTSDFWQHVDELETRSLELQRRTAAISNAAIYTPSRENISSCHREAELLKDSVAKIKAQVQEANRESTAKLCGNPAKRVVKVLTAAASAIADALALDMGSALSESAETESRSASTVIDVVEKQASKEETSSDETLNEDEDEEQGDPHAEHHLLLQPYHPLESRASTSTTPPSTSQRQHPVDMTKLNAKEELAINQLTQSKNWLLEVERDASQTVDVADWHAAKQLWQTVQGIVDEIRMRTVEVTATHDASPSKVVRQQALQLIAEMTRLIDACERRCETLSRMGEEARLNETARNEMDLWLQEAQEHIGEKRVEECSEELVRAELSNIEKLVSQLEERRKRMQEMNTKANSILDTYTKDEAHNLSHIISALNMRWTKFNDNIRIRRAVLEASLRSRGDFHSALAEFEQWLEKQENVLDTLDVDTQNPQAIKDTSKRKQWTFTHKNTMAELSAHEAVLKAVEDMGKLLVDGLDNGQEKVSMQARVSQLSQRWATIKTTAQNVGERLEKAEQEWEKLSDTLASLLAWIDSKSVKIEEQQPVAGNLSQAMQQSAYVKSVSREMEQRIPAYKNTIAEAHSFLMQHDLRPKMQSARVLDDGNDDELGDMEQRRRGLEIHANCEKLKQKWAELGVQVDNWDKIVQQAVQRLQEIERNLAECQLHLSSVEADVEKLEVVEKIHLEDLKAAREETEALSRKVDEVRLHIDDANDATGRLLAANLPLDQHTRSQVDNVNRRYATLKSAVRVRQAALKNALSDFGPSSEHFLNQSVTPPWQRAISKTNLLPYYIDHTTEKTQWEHPVWVEMCKELSQFNRVKFIAYRTAMKLRALQKRLCLDLVDLPLLEKTFSRMKGLSAEECPGLEGMVCSLLPTFEQLHLKYPNQVKSVSLAVDVCINFLLNLFDPSRDGILRVLSFKIALIVFANIPLDEKYKMLFQLVSQDGQASQKQIALLLYDLIHIPRLIGESAAFGGSNVEPSVRSCFEAVRFAPTISQTGFLDWMRKEPQSVVWLAVMHRLIASEDTKHQSKCNVCKMFPIVGLRYRCLSCFNLDMCQNCFFSQRTAKKHKLKHPMQEYSTPTTSSEDARDFARMVRNKLRRSRRTLAYLPVEESFPSMQTDCL
ncbi:unnamed protein product [Caenorhabditis auriculariae]|uniref:Dystrophin n=1 Tax=Caenorhabditis auriculariae TaxID=2777116 RepID=A0A8S1GMK4_9PELO|nr:unnamed protein product [Caenorhabditis auriculariae]